MVCSLFRLAEWGDRYAVKICIAVLETDFRIRRPHRAHAATMGTGFRLPCTSPFWQTPQFRYCSSAGDPGVDPWKAFSGTNTGHRQSESNKVEFRCGHRQRPAFRQAFQARTRPIATSPVSLGTGAKEPSRTVSADASTAKNVTPETQADVASEIFLMPASIGAQRPACDSSPRTMTYPHVTC